jgi:predicted amidophosphoribosyltransferase
VSAATARGIVAIAWWRRARSPATIAAVVLARLVSLVAPPACLACRDPLARDDEVLCPGCRRDLPWLRAPRCARCALPAHAGACPAALGGLDAAWAPLAHEGAARALVHALKFRGAVRVADVMAGQMAANVPAGLLDGAALVPVPMHPLRRRLRGADHAARLAAALGVRTGRPVARCLRRAGPRSRQLGAARADRLARGRVEVRVRRAVPPVAALVDDVHTTGATLAACAAALRAGGARRVVALTYVRALRSG